MMDILICKMQYPNDPTNNNGVHQHFVGFFDGNKLVLYSISSTMGKEYKVFAKDGSYNPDYFILDNGYERACGLRASSFIDCTKGYALNLRTGMNISRLSNRPIPNNIRKEILNKIEMKKKEGKYIEYIIDINAFIANNPRLKTI